MKQVGTLIKVLAVIAKYIGVLLIIGETIEFFTSKVKDKFPNLKLDEA